MIKMYRVDKDNPEPKVIELAAEVLRAGKTAVFPTETVYGIGVCAAKQYVPDEIFDIKRRDRAQTIPWLVEGIEALDVYGIDVPAYAYNIARRYWPGALTLVVRASNEVPPAFLADDGTIALRVPDSKVAQRLIEACECPLATTSANVHGCPSPRSYAELDSALRLAAGIVLDGGATEVGTASTVVSCLEDEPQVNRNSAIPFEEIRKAAL